MYLFRVFERLWGTRKFLRYALTSSIISILLQWGASVATPAWFAQSPAGPYAIIFPLLFRYLRDIPPLAKGSLAGLPLSDKSLMYLAALQLACSSLPTTGISAVLGALAGVLCTLQPPALPSLWDFPDWLASMAAVCFARTAGREPTSPRCPPSTMTTSRSPLACSQEPPPLHRAVQGGAEAQLRPATRELAQQLPLLRTQLERHLQPHLMSWLPV